MGRTPSYRSVSRFPLGEDPRSTDPGIPGRDQIHLCLRSWSSQKQSSIGTLGEKKQVASMGEGQGYQSLSKVFYFWKRTHLPPFFCFLHLFFRKDPPSNLGYRHRDDVTYISMHKQHWLAPGRRAPPLCHFLWPDHSGALRACKTLYQESSKKQPFKLNLHVYFCSQIWFRKERLKRSPFQHHFPRNNEDGESTFVIVQNLGLHESSLNGNYHETGGFVSILGPGIGTDLFGDVPSPLFYEIVKEKDGRHFANKKVSDLGPNNLGFQSSILGSIIFEPEPNRSIFLWRRLLSCIFQSMKLFHLWNTTSVSGYP